MYVCGYVCACVCMYVCIYTPHKSYKNKVTFLLLDKSTYALN